MSGTNTRVGAEMFAIAMKNDLTDYLKDLKQYPMGSREIF